ncbi:MAG: class I SAM-dependent methyltransferase, partial [Nitrososphaera sp.]|nr:class I SAM-dependent methyltransferase [Nitrososphaera sp.]
MSNIIDPQKFKSAQRQGWDSVAEGWRKWWKPIEESSQVVSDKLIELAQIRQSNKVLDVATGIGEPAVTAAKRVRPTGKVTAIDISPQMLAIARERARESGFETMIEFREGDAESFSLPNSVFDAIISRWGLMFLPDLPRALKTMREALVPGGRIAAAVWSSPPNVPMLSLAFGTVMKEIGASPPPPGTPGPFSLADVNTLHDIFEQAGFQDIEVERGAMNLNISSPEAFTGFHQAINAPIKAMIAVQSTARQEEIWNAVTEAARKH